MTKEMSIGRTLVEMADTLVDDFDVVELLTLLSHRCVSLLDVDAAGLLLVSPEGELRVIASSSEAVRVLELFELQTHEGPCWDCYQTGEPVNSEELANDRWPQFAPVAKAAGFRAVHAEPMRLRGQIVGALNLFRVEPGTLSVEDTANARILADVATIAILQHRATTAAQILNEQLNHALNSRVMIEQAKGVLSERLGVNMEEAFALLRGYARNHSKRLVDVAEGIVTGRLSTSQLK